MSRRAKYQDFEKFANGAESRFNELCEKDERAKNLSNFYSFYATKGGADGAIDKRVFEVFYGSRAIDRVQTLESQDGQLPHKQDKLLTERGASLRYERTDAGTVACTLFPAKTRDLFPREDSIVLDWVANPKTLQSIRILRSHWRAFISYMECTSVDGEPTVVDKARVAYLRFMRPLVVDGRVGKRTVIGAIENVIGFALTIGLSGFLLTLINMWGAPSEAENLKAEIAATSLRLAEAKGAIHAQDRRIASLEQRLDAIHSAKAPCLTGCSRGRQPDSRIAAP